MEESALKFLANLAIMANSEGQLESSNCADAMVLSEGQRLEDLERIQPFRRRFRGTYKTSSHDDFAAYVKSHAEEVRTKPRVFVEPAGPLALAIFNLGTVEEPGHTDDRAILTLDATAGWSALRKASTAQLDQRTLIDLIGDWRHLLTKVVADDGAELSVAAAVAAIREIKVKAKAEDSHVTGDFNSNRTRMEQIEASAGAKTPAHLVFRLATHEGLTERDVTLRLGILTGGNAPVLRLRIERLEALEEEIAQDFKRLLTSKLSESAELFIGSFTA